MEFLQRTEFYTVLAYLLLMIGIGFYFMSRNRGGTDYFAGGRCVPWWVSGVSLYMGNFSAWLFTGGAGMLYKTTWYGLLYFLLTGSISYFLGAQLTAVLWRRSRVISPVEFTRRRFGVGTQQVLGIITAVVFIAAAGNQLRAIATVVESILGIDIEIAAIAIGIIVILYTIIGGLWAVVVTDVVQFVVLLGASLLVAPLAFLLVEGGLPEILSNMEFSIPPTDGLPSHNLHFLIAGLISFTLGVASGQGPRFYCVPDEKSARKVGVLAAVLFLTTPVLFSVPSLVARTIWGGPDVLGDHIPGQDPHEKVFIQIAMEVLPAGLLGVFLAAMFAATMSALDTVYNMVASVLSRDMYMAFRPKTTDRQLITVGRAMTVLCGVVTILLCLYYIARANDPNRVPGENDLFAVMVNIFYLSAPVMAVPVLMGFLFRKAPRAAGMACIIWGIATGFVTKVCLNWDTGPQIYLTQSISIGLFLVSPWLGSMWRKRETRGTLVILSLIFASLVLGVMLLGSPKSQPVGAGLSSHQIVALYVAFLFVTSVLFARWFSLSEDRTEVDRFYQDLDTPVDVATEVTGSAEAALSVFRLVGIVTFCIAGGVLVLMGVEMLLGSSESGQWWKYVALATILVVLAVLFYVPGRKAKETADVAS
jgi:solute:Na+ symporter, SSS family